MRTYIYLLLLLALFTNTSFAKKGGILGQKAPQIEVDKWVSLPKGETAPTPKSLKGKIIYLYCFQTWCPGCHSAGFPTLQKVRQHFKDDDNVEFIAIQTVFEGFKHNTPNHALEMVKKFNLQDIAVGHSGSRKKPSALRRGFRTRGTPWTIIIDADGIVKFNDFHTTPPKAIELIEKLQKQKK